jgi:thermitase
MMSSSRLMAILVLAMLVVTPLAGANAPERLPDWTAAAENAPGEVVVQLSLDAVHAPDFRAELLPSGGTGLPGLDTCLGELRARVLQPVFDLSAHPDRKRVMGMDRIFVIRYAGSEDPARAAARLAGLPEVVWAEPNGSCQVLLAPNDTYYPSQWAHNNTGQAVRYGGGSVGTADCDTDTDQAWDLQTGSSSLVLAVIDTGVDTGHPEFSGRVVAGYDFVNSDSNPADDQGHGTCCAGIALGKGNNSQGIAGVAWGVKLMPVKVMDSSGSGYFFWIADGITWAADHGAKILSLSLGSSTNSSLVETAVNYAYGLGCALFCATGNSNGSSLMYPAGYANAIAIGALSPCNERKHPSSCDGEYWWGSNYGTGLDFLAPGVRIHTADIRGTGGFGSGDYITDFNGTSSAAPQAAGIGALVWSENPALTNDELRTLLRGYCDDLGVAGYDTETGYGRLNAYQAVLHAGSGVEPPPEALFSEDFEWDVVPGTVWSATDANSHSGLDYWGDQSVSSGARVQSGSYSAYCADNSNVSGQKYDNHMNSNMTLIDPIDISGYENVQLSFWTWCRTSSGSDYLSLQYWNGSGWTEQQRWSGSHTPTWANSVYSVTGSSLRFRFVFCSNSSGTSEGAYVDNIVVTGAPVDQALGGPTTLAYLGESAEPFAPEFEPAAADEPAAATRGLRVAWSRGQQATALLDFALDQPCWVRLDLFGVDGRLIRCLQDGPLPAGTHALEWDGTSASGSPVATGVFYARLSLDGKATDTRPLLLAR